MASTSLGASALVSYWSSSRDFSDFGFRSLLAKKGFGPGIRISPCRGFRVYCESKIEEKRIRRCSPLLERSSLSGDVALPSNEWTVVPDIWRSSAERYGDKVALVDPYHHPPSKMTYKQLEQEILEFAEGLRVLGLKPDEKIALFADNSCRWLVADQGIMATGAVNVVRGSRSSVEELLHIYSHSGSVALTVDSPEFFNRISEAFSSKVPMRFMILLWGEKSSLTVEGLEMPIYTYTEIINCGQEKRRELLGAHEAGKYEYEFINPDDIAAIMYTSGTTGKPKGVMLTHKNLLHQVQAYTPLQANQSIKYLNSYVLAEAGDKFLSMLPSWHAYERSAEYFIFTLGVEQIYTSIRYLKDDLKSHQPQFLISVPLVYETIYSGIQKQISASSAARKFVALALIRVSLTYMEMKRVYEGLCLTQNQKPLPLLVSFVDWLLARVISAILCPLHILATRLVYRKILSSIGISKAGMSGGASLPMHVDKFFEAVGVTIQNGYGLTETSPVIAFRSPNCNILGSVGHPYRDTEFKIVDSETDNVLPPGSRGIVKVRGPQVMKGYYKNPLATKQVLDDDGWLNTGDMGWIAPYHSIGRSRRCGGVIVIEGRSKDTIVLSTGENVDPLELEEAAMRSNLIQQIVVIGQDRRRLGAIIVPNKDEAVIAAKGNTLVDPEVPEVSKETLTSLINEDLIKWTSKCSFQIGPILIVDEPFSIDNGLLTPTMKIRRDKVVAKYKDEIANLYK